MSKIKRGTAIYMVIYDKQEEICCPLNPFGLYIVILCSNKIQPIFTDRLNKISTIINIMNRTSLYYSHEPYKLQVTAVTLFVIKASYEQIGLQSFTYMFICSLSWIRTTQYHLERYVRIDYVR